MTRGWSTAVEARVHEAKPDLVVISRRLHPARQDRGIQGSVRVSRRGCAMPAMKCSAFPAITTCRLYDVLRRFLSPLTRYRRFIDDSAVPLSRAARCGGARDQHRALADLQGRAHQRRAGRAYPRDFRAPPRRHAAHSRHASSACSRWRSATGRNWARRSGGRTWRWTRLPRRGSTCCWPGIITAPRPTMRPTLSPAPDRRW